MLRDWSVELSTLGAGAEVVAGASSWRGPDDARLRFALARDEQSLWIAAEITDDRLVRSPARRASEDAVRAAARTAAASGGGAAAPTFDTGAVMGTLAEALVATAIGLMVAIPAVAAFNYFQRRVKSLVASSDTLSHVVTASLAAAPAKKG